MHSSAGFVSDSWLQTFKVRGMLTDQRQVNIRARLPDTRWLNGGVFAAAVPPPLAVFVFPPLSKSEFFPFRMPRK